MLPLALGVAAAAAVSAQAPEAKPTAKIDRVMGEVAAVDAATGTLTVKTAAGEATVKGSETTQYLKAKPGATTLEGATPATLADVKVGDRVYARGALTDEGKTLTARQVVVMTSGDIASKHAQEQSDWRRRGLAGVVTALDPVKQEITVEVRAAGAPQTVVISTSEKKAALRRYSGESVKFSDAKPGTFADLAVGDQLRALGDRSEDGTRLTAEQVVSGAFRTVVGAVDAVDAAAGEVKVTDGATNEKVTVAVKGGAVLRRLPPELAARMGARRTGAGAPGEPGGGEGGRREASANAAAEGAPAGEGRPGGGPGRGGPPNLGDLLDRMPVLTLADLKPGDRIAISASRGADAARITAIALVAGIEPLLAAPETGGSRRQGVDLMPGLPAGALDMGMGGP